MRRPPFVNENLIGKCFPHFNPGFHTHSKGADIEKARCRINSESKPGAAICPTSSQLTAYGAVARISGFHKTSLRKIHTILGKGLKICPVTHIRCNRTANFRATAITARFLPGLPSLFDKPHCRSDESLPKCPRM